MLIEPLLRNGIGDRTDAVAMTTKRIAENYTAEIMKKTHSAWISGKNWYTFISLVVEAVFTKFL